ARNKLQGAIGQVHVVRGMDRELVAVAGQRILTAPAEIDGREGERADDVAVETGVHLVVVPAAVEGGLENGADVPDVLQVHLVGVAAATDRQPKTPARVEVVVVELGQDPVAAPLEVGVELQRGGPGAVESVTDKVIAVFQVDLDVSDTADRY